MNQNSTNLINFKPLGRNLTFMLLKLNLKCSLRKPEQKLYKNKTKILTVVPMDIFEVTYKRVFVKLLSKYRVT